MRRILPGFAVLLCALAACAEPKPPAPPATAPPAPPAGQTACTEPRRPICTREYRPVCGSRRDGTHRTYGNGCSACADAAVVSHRPGPCP